MSEEQTLSRIRTAIESLAFVRAEQEQIVHRGGKPNENGWLFDIRRIIMEPALLADLAALFWAGRGREPLQVGGIETGAIPLVVGFTVLKHDRKDVSGFFIRKSRKKDGLMRAIEGTVRPQVPIVLVDDLMNSGKSFIRQIEVLESLGHRVDAVWCVIRFRDIEQYSYFSEKGIRIESLFTLDDFARSLKVHNIQKQPVRTSKPALTHKILWKFASPRPSYHHVVAKSDPAIDDERVYMGSDTGTMWALNQGDGSVAWSHKIGFHQKGKGIFSSPSVHAGVVYFGGYDGNVYALDARTGKKRWIFLEADWVGSSPTVANDLGLVFIGLEFGLWRKRGGIVALDIKTGAKVWGYNQMPCFTHSSPFYIKEHRQVVIGSNDGAAYLFNAKTGDLIWKFMGGTPTERDLDKGFSEFDIKESFTYDPKRDLIIFGNINGTLFFVDRKTGRAVSTFKAEYGFYSTPIVYKDTVIASSIDKHLYCIELDTFQEKWRWYAGARIFATPVNIGESIYIGANTGRLTELDPETGAERSFMTFTERITNKIAYNKKTGRFFVPTFANEIYCLEKREGTPGL